MRKEWVVNLVQHLWTRENMSEYFVLEIRFQEIIELSVYKKKKP